MTVWTSCWLWTRRDCILARAIFRRKRPAGSWGRISCWACPRVPYSRPGTAKADGADYIGVGAVFPTATKKDAVWIGRETLREIKAAAELPVVGIGGIHAGNISQIYGSGIDGVAVVSAVMGSGNPKAAAEELKEMVKQL